VKTLALVGNVVHPNHTTINNTNEIKAPIVAIGNQLHDFMKAIGFLNENGNIYSPNGANLMLNKSSGDIFGMGINSSDYLNPHKLTIPSQTALTFAYRFQNGVQTADTQNINPNIYDVSGVSTAVPVGSRWTVQRINLFQSGIARVQPGQTVYTSFNDAVIGLPTQPFVTEQNIADNAVFRCYLIVQQGTTNLASAVAGGTAQFVPVDKFGNVIGNGSVALTYSNIVAALGYTPANDADVVKLTGPQTILGDKTFSGNTQSTTLTTNNLETPSLIVNTSSSNVSFPNPLITALFKNTSDAIGAQDYHNEVHIRLQAGTTTNHRRYINFADFNAQDKWVTGVNASNDWILYNSQDIKHNIWIQPSTGHFMLNTSTGAIKMNSDPLTASSSSGLEIYDGTLGQTVPTWKFTGLGGIQKNNNNIYINPLTVGGIGATGTMLFSSGTTTSPTWGQSSSLDFSFGGLLAKKNVTNYFVPQIQGASVSEPNKKISVGVNTSTNIGFIQATNEGVSVLPVSINPSGGRVMLGAATDDGVNALQVNGSTKTTALTITSAPTTSAGTYDILTRNTSTGVVEKVLSNTIATIASPTFTGTPTAPTATVGTNTTQIATTAFVLANSTIPTFQQVTTAGATTNVPTIFSTTDPSYLGIKSISGSSDNGIGVHGSSIDGAGVYGESGYNIGVKGYSSGSGDGVYGESLNGNGIQGYSVSGQGVSGSSDDSIGVNAFSYSGVALSANVPTVSSSNIVEFKKNNVNQSSVSHDGKITANGFISNGIISLKNYTVTTLPTGTQGDTAYVTDALAPTYMTTVVGGGAVVTPVFYNGTNWVAH